ncbi:uncharacterized protein N7496_003984 [Penicillium cataractarum]|uniref:Uncharacterized protein n=1 Tax=Penicillium cataractarum TaxID=2100454 RepID=A0A9W9SN47_9EURO|nr:uncharacterized protein N7496_003984 [Penicillium cataractarum]KAJ5381556.1 hypothetical protein N7496_003984 [Penicillium cataractarum]
MKIPTLPILLLALTNSVAVNSFSFYAHGKTIVHDARREIFPCQKINLDKGDNISFFNDNVDRADGCHLTLYGDSKCKDLNGYSYGDWKHTLKHDVNSWSYTC